MSARLGPLQDSAERLRAVLDNASVAVLLMDHRQRCTFMNRAAEELTGFTLAEVLARDEPLHDIIHHTRPDGSHFPLAECAIDRAFPEHNRMTGEEIFVHKDGSFYPVAFTASPIDEAGRTVGTIIEVRSLAVEKAIEAERRAAEQRLREAEHLLTSIGESSADCIYAKDRDGRMLYANRATLAVVGRTAAEVIGKNEREWHHDKDEAEEIMAIDRGVMERGTVERIDEAFTTPGGEQRIYHSVKAPLRDEDGAVIGLVGVTSDVTEQRRAEEHRDLLIHELNHRVKNTLATVQSLAFQSFRDCPPQAFDLFEGRLAALSRAHDTLTHGLWRSAPIADVVSTALEPFRFAGRLTVAGDVCRLEAGAALALSMMLHELGTNACKYGALSGPEGRVAVRWSCIETGEKIHISLRWEESGGPPVVAPERRGFGSRLIERQAAGEFGGSARLDFAPTGLVAEIELNVRPETRIETEARQ
jgi:PAS domain S-box-containing protein